MMWGQGQPRYTSRLLNENPDIAFVTEKDKDKGVDVVAVAITVARGV